MPGVRRIPSDETSSGDKKKKAQKGEFETLLGEHFALYQITCPRLCNGNRSKRQGLCARPNTMYTAQSAECQLQITYTWFPQRRPCDAVRSPTCRRRVERGLQTRSGT